jgi:hypothetical protein
MKRLLLLIASVALAATTVVAASDPQNPCARKAQNPCNPCARKAQNPCNPCARKKGQNPCNPCAKKKGQNPCNPCAKKKALNPCSAKFNTSGKEQTIAGFIGDSQCGLAHSMNMGDDKECALKCVDGGGHFILADRDKKVVYLLDKEAQMKVREFAGQKVKVTGHVNAKEKTIHMTKIEPAS